MTEDNVGICRPAVLKLLMESTNIILFETLNVKLFLSVTSVIFADPEQHRPLRPHCSARSEQPSPQAATATRRRQKHGPREIVLWKRLNANRKAS